MHDRLLDRQIGRSVGFVAQVDSKALVVLQRWSSLKLFYGTKQISIDTKDRQRAAFISIYFEINFWTIH